jgi:AcrR family transcriptional regulator
MRQRAAGSAGNGRGRHPLRLGRVTPAHQRAVGARGQGTLRRLLIAGLAEIGERGFQAATVDDIARRANVSHGTFYVYFANKDDLFGVLAQEALDAMADVVGEFPVVAPSTAGRAALRRWVESFCDRYAAHAAVFRSLSQADVVGQDAWESDLKQLWRFADGVSWGMTAGAASPGGGGRLSADGAHLSAVACLLMLKRVSYLLSAGVPLPRAQMIDRLTAIVVAAFPPARPASVRPARSGRFRDS